MAKESWSFDLAHSSINFWVRHMMVSKVHGRFAQWSGVFELDSEVPASSRVEVTIEAASLDTREAQRDAHLRSADFFDAERFPKITFRSTRIERDGDGYRVTGDLNIRGVTKSTELTVDYGGRVRDPSGADRIGFAARGTVNRRDFGLTWNQSIENNGVLVGDNVEIGVEVEAVKKT